MNAVRCVRFLRDSCCWTYGTEGAVCGRSGVFGDGEPGLIEVLAGLARQAVAALGEKICSERTKP